MPYNWIESLGHSRLKQATIVHASPLLWIDPLKTWHMILVLCNCFQIITFCYNSQVVWCFAICFQIIAFWVTTPELLPCWCKEKKRYHMRNERVPDLTDVKWENAINVLVVCTYYYSLQSMLPSLSGERRNLRASHHKCCCYKLYNWLPCCTSSEPLRLCRVIGD